MKRAIAFRDIQIGDLVRCESTDEVLLGDNFVATEWYATDEDLSREPSSGTAYYLLDRPDPFPEGSTWYISEDCKSWFSTAKRGEKVTINRSDPESGITNIERSVRVVGDDRRTGIVVNTKYLTKDRPTPPVELPDSGLHLGWLTSEFRGQSGRDLMVFRFDERGIEDASYGSIPRERATAWTAATAVPTEALAQLKAVIDGPGSDDQYVPIEAVETFLATIPTPGDPS